MHDFMMYANVLSNVHEKKMRGQGPMDARKKFFQGEAGAREHGKHEAWAYNRGLGAEPPAGPGPGWSICMHNDSNIVPVPWVWS